MSPACLGSLLLALISAGVPCIRGGGWAKAQWFIRCQSEPLDALILVLSPEQQTFNHCFEQIFEPVTWQYDCWVHERLSLYASMMILWQLTNWSGARQRVVITPLAEANNLGIDKLTPDMT